MAIQNLSERVSTGGGGGGGAVDSVNGKTGTVVLNSDDIDDNGHAHKFASQAQLDEITTNATDILGKEDDLGLPSQSGYILSSNTSGQRTWVPAPSGGGGGAVDSWNSRIGIVVPQTGDYDADMISTSGTDNQFISSSDLAQIGTNTGNIVTNASNIGTNTSSISANTSAIATKEDNLGDPAQSGYILSSTTSGTRSWIELPDAGGDVDSVFGRTGEVIAQFGDYNADEIDDSVSIHKFAVQSQLDQISTNTTDIAGKENTIPSGNNSQYWRGDKTFQNLNKAAVGLSNVDNTSDAAKPISTATQNALNNKVNIAEVGQSNGIAELDGTGKVPASQLPSYVSDVQEYADFASFPATGQADTIYVAIDTGIIYRWSGSIYVEISASSAVWGDIDGELSNQKDLQDALDDKINTSREGSANGIATLDGTGKLQANQLPNNTINLIPELVSLTAGRKIMEAGYAYLVIPDPSTPGNNQLVCPSGSTGDRIYISDINYLMGTYNVFLQSQAGQTIDGFDNIVLDVDHCWIELFFMDGEWKTIDPYAGG